jgi:hypothetical protein
VVGFGNRLTLQGILLRYVFSDHIIKYEGMYNTKQPYSLLMIIYLIDPVSLMFFVPNRANIFFYA